MIAGATIITVVVVPATVAGTLVRVCKSAYQATVTVADALPLIVSIAPNLEGGSGSAVAGVIVIAILIMGVVWVNGNCCAVTCVGDVCQLSCFRDREAAITPGLDRVG